MPRVALRLVADTLLVAILLFASAGTLRWWRAWVLLAALLLVRGVGARVVHRVHPDLLIERARLPLHATQPRTDRLLVLAVLATGFVGLPVVAALDAFRWHLLPFPEPAVSALGLALFVLGWTMKSAALHANAYAVAVVRVQRERRHAVADAGVYGIVRHPFYAADPLILVGLGLWLESYAAALGAIVPLACMVLRLRLEERVLRRELPGYDAYAARVRYRLIPRVW
ncbi:methyltransferase family protein [Roseisolibacter agri]|uniref:Isoprenylcysteine carboxyl methyltransferase n=1 Tax=Roseisolibacter agri TaxID=2014610 RepID=A0AA37V301_9BACT|nr:isoprenylcysteine carboxylmethyltransferase family protein [Roseisolibacter agri]GLC25902.1 isoprenylcysteine carboxyl methyltransferase [Roseisolibacter agri]